MTQVTLLLLAGAVILALSCSIAMLIARTPLQRLHYLAPVGSIGGALLTLALLLSDPQKVAALKGALVTVLLVVVNAVVAHATARAIRTRQLSGVTHDDRGSP
jgi:multisubunit Na+/H+ antiporter MnhG subunit